jgi:hypothetical protein
MCSFPFSCAILNKPGVCLETEELFPSVRLHENPLSGLSSCGQTSVMKVGGSYFAAFGHEGAKSDSLKLITGSRYLIWPLVVGMLVLDMVGRYIKTTNDQSTQLYFIWNTLHVSDHSINHQVSTDLKFIGKCNSHYMFQTQYLWDPTLQNKCYNKIVICK